MAAPDPNARLTEAKKYTEKQVRRTHHLIEKCLDQYMDRDETAPQLEVEFGINPQVTHIVWDGLEEENQEFFQNYYTKLALKRLIIKINELLEQPPRAMDFPLVPAQQQRPMELAEKAPQADSPVSITNNENEADKPPAIPVCFVGSEDVAGSDPNLVSGCRLARSSLEGQGMKINDALDAALMPILQVQNLIAGGNHTVNFRGPTQPSSSLAGSSRLSDSNPEASDQKDWTNLASSQGSQSADL